MEEILLLYFVTDDGDYEFLMEVRRSDSLLKIKEEIQKAKGIPIANQTLTFNGSTQILPDDFIVGNSDYVFKSLIVVKIDPPWEGKTEVPIVFLDENKNPLSEEEILLKFPRSSELVNLKVDVYLTVSQLKFLIKLRFQEMQTTPASQIMLFVEEGEGLELELEDCRTLHQCQIKKDSIVAVHLRTNSRKKRCTLMVD